MKRTTLAVIAGLLLPAAATATPAVNVEVHVGATRSSGWNTETLIDFRPDSGAFVALYAAYSDGSVHLVFPAEDWRNHWVEPGPPTRVAVRVPAGLRLESVQAVASRSWFDPAACWVTVAPRHHGDPAPCVTVVTYDPNLLFAWNFAVAWGSSHRYEGARIECRQPLVVATAGRDAALPRTHRWTSGGRPELTSSVKFKAAPGTETSTSPRKTGEPGRRSRR
jgi:hypothetical protein